MIKFLADENVEWPVVVWLRQNGYDVTAIKEVLPGVEDDFVLSERQIKIRSLQ